MTGREISYRREKVRYSGETERDRETERSEDRQSEEERERGYEGHRETQPNTLNLTN